MSRIRISSASPSFEGYEPALRRAAKSTLKALGAKNYGVDILVADAAEMRRLNKKFKGSRRITDVLSFGSPNGSRNEREFHGEKDFLGDIAVCFDLAKERSAKSGGTLSDELSLYLIHGILHLLGWNDRNPAERAKMDRMQEGMLARCRKGH